MVDSCYWLRSLRGKYLLWLSQTYVMHLLKGSTLSFSRQQTNRRKGPRCSLSTCLNVDNPTPSPSLSTHILLPCASHTKQNSLKTSSHQSLSTSSFLLPPAHPRPAILDSMSSKPTSRPSQAYKVSLKRRLILWAGSTSSYPTLAGPA